MCVVLCKSKNGQNMYFFLYNKRQKMVEKNSGIHIFSVEADTEKYAVFVWSI